MSSSRAVEAPVWCLRAITALRFAPRTARLNASPFLVGRRHDAQLILDCPSVSGLHAELVAHPTGLEVRDLKSTNGTFVNGRRVTESAWINAGDYVQFANVVFRVEQQSPASSGATAVTGACDQSLALVQFDKLMSEHALLPYFQPIVAVPGGRIAGFEVLARSRLFGLHSARELFTAAATLEQEAHLSRLCRQVAVGYAAEFPVPPTVFLNTHPCELADLEALHKSLLELRAAYSHGIVLEIHEGAATSSKVMRDLRSRLNSLDIRLAYDDFGAGQARFLELVEVPPDYLKFDMQLVRNIAETCFAKQHILRSLVQTTRELGITTLAEGVETEEEHESCSLVGFELAQGYYYGRPEPMATYTRGRRRT